MTVSMEYDTSKGLLAGLNLAAIVFLVLCLFLVGSAFYTAFVTPLRSVPGPLLARFTNLPLKIKVMSGRRVAYIHQLHHSYGSIVRISPNELSIADPDAFQTIYRTGSGFLKSDFYQKLVYKVHPGIFTMINPDDHRERRKLFARPFAKTYLRANCEGVVRERVDLAIAKLKEDGQKGPVDAMKWWYLMAADVISTLSFGEPFGLLEAGEKTHFLELMEHELIHDGITAEFTWIRPLLPYIPLEAVQRGERGRAELFKTGGIAVRNARSQGANSTNIFSAILNEADKGDERLSDDAIECEAVNNIIAGTDTTATTLTYLIYAVLLRPDLRIQLETEVSHLPTSFTDSDTETLVLLNAVIEESLRLYQPVAGTLPRTVPQGGADLGGYFVPAGTIVGTQNFTLHRDPNLFSRPEEFDPSRWLPGGSSSPEHMSDAAKKAYSPFGAGSRSCIGLHLARMELRLTVAMFFRECKGARLGEGTTPESMETVSYFLLQPRGMKCEIVV